MFCKNFYAGNHWVMSDGYASVWGIINPTSIIHKVFPVGYENINMAPKKSSCNKIIITIFDVEPRNQSYLNEHLLDEYYSYTVSRKFIADIIESVVHVKNNLKCSVELKVKGKLKSQDSIKYTDTSYIGYLDDLVRNKIICYSRYASVIDLIMESTLTISFPFTTTAVISNGLNVPCIWYDPLSILKSNQRSDIELVEGKTNLQSFIELVLSRNMAFHNDEVNYGGFARSK